MESITYFDNAATSWPKPPEVIQAMQAFQEHAGASPGRSAHRRSLQSGRVLLEAREELAALFGADDPLRIILTKNATEALNLASLGLLNPGDHCITSSLEHNALMRPLRSLEPRGILISQAPCSSQGLLDPDDIKQLITPATRIIYLVHASNVTGSIQPLAEVGRIAREHGLLFCVDAAQSAGVLPIDVDAMNIDLLAFTGHKSLYGPQGTGGLYMRDGLEKQIRPLMLGGTGSRSELEQQPEFLPDKFESGTINGIGIAGLAAGLRFVRATGLDKIRTHELALTKAFVDGARDLNGLRILGPENLANRIALVSFTLDGYSPAELALMLDEDYGILARPGLHCAPAAHKTVGTFPDGALRFAFSWFNTSDEIHQAIKALEEICAK